VIRLLTQPRRVTSFGLVTIALVLTLTACSSTASAPSATLSQSSKSTIPPAAFKDHTGITPSSVSIGNISTLTGGLFTGALVGTEAYAAFVNAQGGINGRKDRC
jgi:ABC-type oligopeptide transport system substrate-binding subunit